MRELRKVWRRVLEELNNRVIEFVARGMKGTSPRLSEGKESGAYDERGLKERNAKVSAANSLSGDFTSEAGGAATRSAKALEMQCLNDLSLKRFKQWIEEDEDKRLTEEKEDALEKLTEAKKSHEQFVRKKDGLRIRLPEKLEVPSGQSMGFGREVSAVKATAKGAKTTVELLAGSGLKYVHASNKGRVGVPGDLEKSKQLLLKLGHVHRENFESLNDYVEEKKNNTFLVEKQQLEQKQKEDNLKAYEEWIQQKELRDQALHCLSLLEKPMVDYSEYVDDCDNNVPVYASTASLRQSRGGVVGTGTAARKSLGSLAEGSRVSRTIASGGGTIGLAQTPANMAHFQLHYLLDDHMETFQHVLDVGKALKKVDRTLFTDWVKWSEQVIPTQIATILWDYFHPMACDVHSSVYSQVRDTFLKLLRPGKDYKEIFLEYVERKIFAPRADRFKQMRDFYRLDDEEKAELLKELEDLKKNDWMKDVALTKTQFTELLGTMGITLKKQELTSVFDAFDVNHDGVITLVEFLDFIGPKREKRAGQAMILSQRCCWLTTCSITGMANGYSISQPTFRLLKENEESKQRDKQSTLLTNFYKTRRGRGEGKDGDYDDEQRRIEEEENYKLNTMKFTGKSTIKRFPNGEMRVVIELRERQKREDLLRKMGLLDDQPSSSSRSPGRGGRDGGRSSLPVTDRLKKGLMKALHGRDSPDGENYDDDYEQDYERDEDQDPHYSDDEDHDKGGKGGRASVGKRGSANGDVISTEPCSYSLWSLKSRREGLKFLLSITKDAREEEALKSLLSNGTAPKPPKFWIRTRRIAREILKQGGTMGLSDRRSTSGSRRESTGDRRSTSRARSSEGEEEGMYTEEEYEDDYEGGNGGGRGGGRGRGRDLELDEGGDPTTQLTLYWAPSEKSELVSFYSIEYGGAVTTTTKKTYEVNYIEIYRDPEDADLGNAFAFQYTVSDLQPGTSYRFRIRAFNGFGPGDYTYKTFTTLTAAPLEPRVIRLTSDCVTLRWTFSKEFFQRLEELKAIFRMADRDGSGCVDREELTAIFHDKVSESKDLLAFLRSIASAKGLDLKQGYGALFDLIEADDDGGLSWEEFQNFFMSAGWTSGAAGAGSVSGGGGGSVANKSLASASNALSVRPGDITYVVEKCESEFDDVYREVLRTTAGHGTISRLEPGHSYRFRIYSLNADEVPGEKSKDIVVHTLLETPAAPSPVPKTINARSITVTWKARNYVTSTRHQAFIDKMVGDWAHSHGSKDGGVSIEAAFAKYDRNQSGDIDRAEFAAVLEDLGIPVTEERLFQAFNQLDADKSGTISFEEFGNWWRGDRVSYVLKRSNEIAPSSRLIGPGMTAEENNYTGNVNTSTNQFATSDKDLSAPNTATSSLARPMSRGRYSSSTPLNMSAIPEELDEQRSKHLSATNSRMDRMTASRASSVRKGFGKQVGVPVVSYRGTRTRVEIAGLTPNALYHFKLRYVGARSNSILSPPLVVMTAPLPPSSPALIDLSCNTVRVKWYPSEFGAYKFAVHMRPIAQTMRQQATSQPTRRAGATIIGQDLGEDGWILVYLGPDNHYTCTTLSTECSYELRVCAVNYQGTSSEPSASLVFTTLARNDTSNAITAKSISRLFTVECTGDICVGDTILITERLFLRPKSVGTGHEVTTAPDAKGGASVAGGRSVSRGKTRPSSASATRSGQLRGDVNVAASVTSIRTTVTENDGYVSITPSANAQFIGERTFAAIVTKDNYRSSRDYMESRNITIDRDYKQFSATRKVWLEIVWQKSSTELSKKYELKPGEILERFQSHLELFEVFRCPWQQEAMRKSLKQEWETLRDCFLDVDLSS